MAMRQSGGGRGRGRGRGQEVENNVWARRAAAASDISKAEKTFKLAKQKNEENLKRALENTYESSSDEDDLEKNGSGAVSLISSVFQGYSNIGGELTHLGRTEQHIENALQSGAVTCLICISSVKRPDAIWSCNICYCVFHLQCIQHWVRDSVSLKQLNSGQLVKTKINWVCPNCRNEYEPSAAPQRYYCFCGKVEKPPVHPWLIPHSCGETCEKPLQPLCGHDCLLLCHPGPCPPCPKTVSYKCYCGNSQPKPQRCGSKEWSCGNECKRKLLCMKHTCTQPCHPGDCMTCPKQSVQFCLCGSSKKTRPCASPVWQCTKVCDKALDCGHHSCEEVCHKGDCKPCKLNGERFCPCGKTSARVSCIETVPTCGDTCDKILECGAHRCIQRCHTGKCGACLERTVKLCRCGRNSKEVPCVKSFFCEAKCKETKDCGKHACNRKCCDKICPPCDKPCNKTLQCRNHKCAGVCHPGPCFPCMLTESITCRCGGTEIKVPCGTKKRINPKPPNCLKNCKLPSNCNHKTSLQEKHRCHFGPCPPCQMKCNIRMKCGHHCQLKCHTNVLVEITPKNPSTAPQGGSNLTRKTFPCGQCDEPVVIPCLGGHEQLTVPCKDAKTTSCGRPCGAVLPCTNHTCQKICHDIKDPDSKCESCDRRCEKPTLEGCTHPCLQTCHPGPCKPCNMLLKKKCHCNVLQKWIDCYQWCSVDTEGKNKLISCGGLCPKKLPCGHPCTENCHPGDCPNADTCRKKTKVFCACHRIKSNISCDLIRAGRIVECDEICKKKLEEERLIKEKEEEEKEEIRKKKEKEEFEAYQKKMSRGPRRRNDRRKDEKESSSLDFYRIVALGSAGLVLVSLITYFFLRTTE